MGSLLRTLLSPLTFALRALLTPIVLMLLALLTLAVLIWWIGPVVQVGTATPLASPAARALLIGVIALLVLLPYGWRRWRARRASRQLTDQLARPAAAPLQDAAPGESQVLDQRFGEAIRTLRQMRLHRAGGKPGWRDWLSVSGGSYLYELPWYVFIGAPGSGKTTALVNSGLSFPLAEKYGPGAIRGVGGTRNCDWWFTDEAVLIDTAGRYTTQDSDQAGDRQAWDAFLDLLKKTRPRRPLNGVVLTVSAADLLQQGPAERGTHAAALRARLQELDARLATRLPVYVLVTKADLLHGFTAYFDDLGKAQRAQVLGFTLAQQEGGELAEKGVGPFFGREFGLLAQRLADGLVDRLQQEGDSARRADIFAFPAQFAAMGPALEDLLNQVFVGSRYTHAPLVRGVYFTSGTQEGSPIDRVMGALARSFALPRAALPAQSGSARSYFLTTLLKEVVFPEQLLAGADMKAERRRHVSRAAALTLLGLLAVGLLALGGFSAWRNTRYLAAVDARVAPMQEQLAQLPSQVQDPRHGITALAPVLAALRDVWRVPENGEGDPPLAMTAGFYQGDKIDAAAALAHRHALDDVLLPLVTRRIEAQLRGAGKEDLEFTYEALKAYLMLHQPEHFDAEALKAWVLLDWSRSLDRGIPETQVRQLEQQLNALVDQGPPRTPLQMDEALVRNVRAMLASYPLEQRIFSRLKRQRLARGVPDFSVAAAAGPSAPLVFERASGKPLADGVPGLFTYDGYHQRFQQAVAQVTPQLAAEEPWVLGLDAGGASRARDALALPELTDRVRRLYLREYVSTWEGLLADLRLVRGGGVEKSIEVARVLSGADSPLARLLRAVAKETTLVPAKKDGAGGALDRAAQAVRGTRRNLEELLGGGAAPATEVPGKPIESIVDDRFEPLHRLVDAPAGQPAPIDDVLKLFNEVYVYLNAVDTALKSRSSPPPGDVAGKLRADAARLPEPVRSMVENLSQTGAAEARVAERDNLSQDLRPVAEFCQRAIAGRYPFDPRSNRDVLPDDFGQMFGPGGLMDEFFQKRLAALVDTSTRPWRYKPVAEQGAITTAALAQFERAARIRDIFFRAGGRTPSIRFDFRPVEMDASITQFILDVDGQLVRYSHGPVVPMAVQWPGPKGSNQVRVQLSPPSAGGGASGLTVDGPWALFRAFDQAQLEPADAPERFFITFAIDGRRTRLEVTANSVQHPVRLRELREFACPRGL
ncbi:MAG TPA: type VI secretion system membrane subunit TssM [Ottowia sp.]|uniref:type VI secretion system membrane subunit TssM n=1 Tax=Ottowia sp. TaxID=1898956 RepID=UPI002B814353|nr:type VI secretion system membrane subunit TssM [Ottowia sp.]HMN20123.1 type VI secretion system membrane subunit TssM [Ottowia sp.]